MATDNDMLVELTADIVLAHVSNNSIAGEDVASLIKTVYGSLQGLGAPIEVEAAKPTPAVSIRASIKPTHLVSMIDGKPYTMLKRHLAKNGLTPASYREAFNLPADYPMTCADYIEKRKAIAHKIGLGRKPKAQEPAPTTEPARKPREKKAAVAPKAKLKPAYQEPSSGE